MLNFVIRFFLWNILLAFFFVFLFAVRRVLGRHLSRRSQYRLWFVMLALLAVPFLPFSTADFLRPFSRLTPALFSLPESGGLSNPSAAGGDMSWINDFSVSAEQGIPVSLAGACLTVWAAGMCVMSFFLAKARIRLYTLERASLPLEDTKVCALCSSCMASMKLERKIPFYTTAYFYSPFTVGFLRPRIYLPLSLLSECKEPELRLMILHELKHFCHRDALVNLLMNLARVFYWFHPCVWLTLREMKNDMELACDSSVLEMLSEDEYEDYGHTLLCLAGRISRPPSPFAAGMGGGGRQLRDRILNIVSYRPPTRRERLKSRVVLSLTAVLALVSTTLLPAQASENNSPGSSAAVNAGIEDLSSYFEGYDGCFVLFDMRADSWQIYNEPRASLRVSPDSTYKIYSGLEALEKELITPGDTSLSWDGTEYPIIQWNRDQTLGSALQYSVNWYFQTLDRQAGLDSLEKFYRQIGYGNQDLSGGISQFWLESSLRISALEQVQLLKKFYTNEFRFREENIRAVKDAMLLSSSGGRRLYGKTGTGNVDGEYVNGWFIGFVETGDNTFFFAANIGDGPAAGGSAAGEITLDILRDKGIYEY